MDIPYIDYDKLKVKNLGNGAKKFKGQSWQSRSNKRKDIMMDETMTMQGSFLIIPKKW